LTCPRQTGVNALPNYASFKFHKALSSKLLAPLNRLCRHCVGKSIAAPPLLPREGRASDRPSVELKFPLIVFLGAWSIAHVIPQHHLDLLARPKRRSVCRPCDS
jgi:hypothetical protein